MRPSGGGRPGVLARTAATFTDGLGLALVRFPVASLLIAAFFAVSILAVEGVGPFGRDDRIRLLSMLATAAAAAAAGSLFGEALRKPRLFRFASSLAGAIPAGVVVWFDHRLGVFAPAFAAAVFLGVPLAPHVMRSNQMRFWTFLAWGGFGVALAFASVLLFVLGVSAMLEMVRYLFGVGLSSRAYEYIYVTAATLVGPLFALGRIPQDLAEEAAISDDRLSSGLRILQNWVSAPLVLVMALVLHAYAAKIVSTGEWPKNQIGWIVGGFALFLLSTRVAVSPFVSRYGFATRLLGRTWAFALPVPLALLAYALFLRIGAEGVTTERYYLALAAISVGAILSAQVPRRSRGEIRVMTAIPVVLLLLSAFGPWGVSAVVARSQVARLAAEVPHVDGELQFTGLGEEERIAVRSRVDALQDAGALDALLPRLSEADRAALAGLQDEALETTVVERLGLAYGSVAPPHHYSFSASDVGPFDVAGYDTVFAYPGAVDPASATQLSPSLIVDGGDIVVRYLGTTDRIDIAPILRAPPNPADLRAFSLDLRTRENRSLRLFVRALSFDPRTGGEFNATFDLALRRAEWPAPTSFGGDRRR